VKIFNKEIPEEVDWKIGPQNICAVCGKSGTINDDPIPHGWIVRKWERALHVFCSEECLSEHKMAKPHMYSSDEVYYTSYLCHVCGRWIMAQGNYPPLGWHHYYIQAAGDTLVIQDHGEKIYLCSSDCKKTAIEKYGKRLFEFTPHGPERVVN
jgi:hypothetical protein